MHQSLKPGVGGQWGKRSKLPGRGEWKGMSKEVRASESYDVARMSSDTELLGSQERAPPGEKRTTNN